MPLDAAMDSRPRVAAIVTEYRPRSHAENLVDKLLEGYPLFWTPMRPRTHVVSLYTDQVPDNDVSRAVAARHHLPIFPTIREALTLGGDQLAVDGVVLVGEHGDYPLNEKGQKAYPRRRFFEETVAVFRESGRVVPVFNDKHLAWNWADAKWMYDTAQELGIPFMAGSSMPIAFRCPPGTVPLGAERAFLVEYRDGLRVTVLMLAGYAQQWGAAVRLRGQAEPLAYEFIQDRSEFHSNFSHLTFLVEELLLTARSPYPVERTLLASGLIDAAMTSHDEDGRRIETPHLAIEYAPADAWR